jgi:alpha-amylase
MMFSPDSLTFCLISFEGPDRYAQAGGLGVRVTNLAQTLAKRGFETHLLFVGDPALPGQECQLSGMLTLHRWCQWISTYYPAGVYDGEDAKLRDFNDSLPSFIVRSVIRPAIEKGCIPVILAEEWQTAEALIRLSDMLHAEGLRNRCLLFWNANNSNSFSRVDWPRLNFVAQLTTVSRYMKHLMWRMGLNPLVIPNGIPSELLDPVDPERVAALKQLMSPDGTRLMLFKVGRFDPAKRWLMAVEAAGKLKRRGIPVSFPLRGGIEPHGWEVMERARSLGLSVANIDGSPASWDDVLRLLAEAGTADLYNLRFFMPQSWLRPFYAASDAVLANSGHEPFGLVGLEAMAAGGVVFIGATGEEYTLGGRSAVALDTDQPEEIVDTLQDMRNDPALAHAMRVAAREAAAAFTWERVCEILLEKIHFVASEAGILQIPTYLPPPRPETRARDIVIYTVVHQPRRLRLPARPLPDGAPPEQLEGYLFDEPMNERYLDKVAKYCYQPATQHFLSLVEAGLKLSIGFSWSFIEQAQRWNPGTLELFRHLVSHQNVELVAVEPTHSFLLLWDAPRFIERMQVGAERLERVFGVRPVIADTTELMMSDTIYYALARAGFKAAFLDGRPWLLEWRQPTYLYHHGRAPLQLLTRHHTLSDDVGYRFSDRRWDQWPLTADRYAGWLANNPGQLVVLGWDYETFGEHHSAETGIFDFLNALPGQVEKAGLRFVTPSEAITRHQGTSYELPLPAFASTWAGSGGLEFFLGNEAQRAVFQLMIQAYNKARLTENPKLIELALWLAQSDNLHLIQWFGRSGPEAEVSAYFTPHEWWSLGPGRIVWEIQQVYKNFISALDSYLPSGISQPAISLSEGAHLGT